MATIADIPVELAAIVGDARVPLGELLKLGRGAVLPLGISPDGTVALFAGSHEIAAGDLTVSGDRVSIAITALRREAK